MMRAARDRDVMRWLTAFGIVAGAHAAAVALMLRDADTQPWEEPSGALIVELAPIAASTPAKPVELPPGLTSTDSVEAPEIAPSAEAVPPQQQQPELPVLPVLSAVPPEMILPKPVEKPPDDRPPEEKEARQQPTTAQAASIASRAAAPPPMQNAALAEKPAAPAAGVSERDRRINAQWQGALSAHLLRHARFPAAVRDHARELQTIIRFRVDRRGQVTFVAIAESSGSALLDAEAEAMVRRASPMPVPPDQLTSDALDLVVPVRFKARR